MPDALDMSLEDQRVLPVPRPAAQTGAERLPMAGNAATARLLQDGAGPALTDPASRTSNAEFARAVAERPPAAGGGGAAPPAAFAGVGAHGEQVRDAQVKLSRLQASALPLTEDGRYGPLTEAAVRTFQASTGAVPVTGLLDPLTKVLIDLAFAALPPPVRSELRLGATGADVGFAQQKLNALGATPRLAVTGVYDAAMSVTVITFEVTALRRLPTGVVDAAMWAVLDARVAGGFTAAEGSGGALVEQNTPSGTADSLGTQVPGTSLHPVVGAGGLLQGPAVRELQQKLNTAGAAPALADDGIFGPLTRAAVQAFQGGRTPALPVTGIVDGATWAALDAVAPGSTAGAVERQWTEQVGGVTYSLTGADASRYSWEIRPDRMLITVKVNFVGLPPPGAWFGHVGRVWNRYQGVETASRRALPIDFQMIRGSGGDAMTVEVKAGTGRANAGEWFAADTDAAETVPHEYGHLIGLQDEYQLHPGDYVRVTGHEPKVGDAAGPGVPAATIAANLRAAMLIRSDTGALTASAGVSMGAFAQQVVQEYAKLPAATVPAVAGTLGPPPVPAQPAVPLTGDLIKDLDAALPDSGDRYTTIQVYSFSSGSIMGDSSRAPDPHDHGAQPRHIAEFTAILGRSLGGTWEAKLR